MKMTLFLSTTRNQRTLIILTWQIFTASVTLFFFLRFYLFVHERDREREEETIGRGRNSVHAGSLMWDLVPGPPGSRPEPKADGQPLSHPDAPSVILTKLFFSGICECCQKSDMCECLLVLIVLHFHAEHLCSILAVYHSHF